MVVIAMHPPRERSTPNLASQSSFPVHVTVSLSLRLSPIISREGNDAVNFGTNQDEFETAVEDDCSARRTGVLRAYSMSSARCVGRYGRGGCWRAALQLEGDWCLSSGKQAGGGGPAVHGWSRRPTERHHWPQGGGPARCRDAGRRQRVRCEQDARGPGCSP